MSFESEGSLEGHWHVGARNGLIQVPVFRAPQNPLKRPRTPYRKPVAAPMPYVFRPGPPTVRSIQALVCNHFGLELADMTNMKRKRMYARPRQIAMYLARKHSKLSWPRLAKNHFGGRDHSTLYWGVKTIKRLMEFDYDLRRDVHALEAKIEMIKAVGDCMKAVEVLALEDCCG